MENVQQNTRVVGELTELKCQIHCLKQGFIVSKPIIDNARYDLILDHNGKFYRVQVKTSRWMSEEQEGIVFNAKSQYSTANGNKTTKYTSDEIDFFMTEFQGECYLIPCDKPRTEIKLRFKPTKNNQDNRAMFAKDYLFEEVIKRY